MDISDALDLFNQYIVAEKGLSNQTSKSYMEDLKHFFEFYKDKKDTSDLMGEDLLDYLKYEISSGKSISTALRRLSSSKSFYLFLKKEGYLEGDIPQIETPKKPLRLPSCLSIEQVEDLLEAPDLTKPDGVRDRAMLETMYASGLRVSELLLLETSRVNLDKNIVTIFGKGAKERKVPLGDFAIEYIIKYINEVNNIVKIET